MNRAERDRLRASIRHWKPTMTIEVRVDRMRALLDECDALDDQVARLSAQQERGR